MSNKSAQTKKMLAQNADKIAIAVLALIFAGLLYAWWQEQSNTLGSDAATGRDAALTDEIATSPAFEMLTNMTGNPTLESNPAILRVAQFNMFDFSTLQQESAAEEQAIQQIAQARQLIEQGETDQARTLLEQATSVVSYDESALQLLDSITTPTEAAVTMDPSMDPSLTGEQPIM